MEQHEMIALVDQHLKAEFAGDIEGTVAVYTDDIVHEDIGMPGSPRTGKDGAREFYNFLNANVLTESEETLHRCFDGDTMIVDQNMDCTVIGEFMGLPGNGRKIMLRIMHVFDFRDGLISREQVWLDGGGTIAQLTAP